MSNLSCLPETAAEELGVHSALTAMAIELACAQKAALGLQETVHEIVGHLDDQPFDALFELQGMDRLAQILGDLATFSEAMVDKVPENLLVRKSEIAGSLHLRDLADRLTGQVARSGPVTSGDDDMFFEPL